MRVGGAAQRARAQGGECRHGGSVSRKSPQPRPLQTGGSVLTHANLFVIKSGTLVSGCADPKRFYPHFPANTDPVDPCIGALGSIPLGTESCPGVNGCA